MPKVEKDKEVTSITELHLRDISSSVYVALDLPSPDMQESPELTGAGGLELHYFAW